MQRRHALTLAAAASLAPLATVPRAQGFPSRTVRIVVPATAGSADVFARALAQRLTPVLGQQVIVEQKPGAGTHIGNDHVARSAPDGHTMLINSLPLVTGDALYSKLSYNTARDLRPVILVAEVTNIITVHPSLGVNTLKELVDLARRYAGPSAYQANHGTNVFHDGDGLRHFVDDAAAEEEPLDRWERFHAAVEQLTPEQKEAFRLVWYLGADQKTTAAVMGCSERSVKNYWRQARDAVKAALGGEPPQ